MVFEVLKQNIRRKKQIIKQLEELFYNAKMISSEKERKAISENAKSLINQLLILNRAIPNILDKIEVQYQENKKPLAEKSSAKKPKKRNEKLINVSYKPKSSKERTYITINKEDKKKFLKELNIEYESLKRIKKPEKKEKEKVGEFRKPNQYVKFSNRFFSNYSKKLAEKEFLSKVKTDLKKADMPFLTESYISVMLMTTLISFFVGIILFIILIFVNMGFGYPFISLVEESFGLRILKIIWVIPIIPILVFLSLYYYPATEASSLEKKINQEIPFVVIHMSAIAGSGIEPLKIFRVIAMSEEYEATKKEISKLINQVNVYGYDLSSALKNCAKKTPSKRLSELFSGLSTTISSGGKLTTFLNKRSESLLLDYRLEREKFTQIAGTFMDIYISVVIAAPMILLLLMVLLNVTGIEVRLSANVIAAIIILAIALINVLFLVIMQLKQPKI